MRSYFTLDHCSANEETGVLQLSSTNGGDFGPTLSMRREGGYVSISVGFGPVEIALRPRFQELERVFSRLRPVPGLQTTRQVGTGQAYVALGLRDDGSLMMRPTIVADATGHICYNLVVTPKAREELFSWLSVTGDED